MVENCDFMKRTSRIFAHINKGQIEALFIAPLTPTIVGH
jgi:hypothetical protein